MATDKDAIKKVSDILNKIEAKEKEEAEKAGVPMKRSIDKPMTREFEKAMRIFFGDKIWKMKDRRKA